MKTKQEQKSSAGLPVRTGMAAGEVIVDWDCAPKCYLEFELRNRAGLDPYTNIVQFNKCCMG